MKILLLLDATVALSLLNALVELNAVLVDDNPADELDETGSGGVLSPEMDVSVDGEAAAAVEFQNVG